MQIHEILRASHNIDSTQLQEKYCGMIDTYLLVATFADDPEVAQIAKRKLEKLKEAGQAAGLHEDNPIKENTDFVWQNISDIRIALSSVRADTYSLHESGIIKKIAALPDIAEKYYLSAVVTLISDSSLEGYKSAVEYLNKAIECDSSNEAYQTLLVAISEQLAEYENEERLRRLHRQEVIDREAAERERNMRSAINDAERVRVRNASSNKGTRICCGIVGGYVGFYFLYSCVDCLFCGDGCL